MKKINIDINIANILLSFVSYVVSIIFYYNNLNIITAIILVFTGLALFIINKKDAGYYTNILGVFSLVWFVAVGLATLRLHHVQSEWNYITWICIGTTYIAFNLGYLLKKNLKQKTKKQKRLLNKKDCLNLITLLFIFVFFAFWTEVVIRRSIPIFSNDMSAYQKFSVTGIHYFTVSCALILPLSYLFCSFYKGQITKMEYFFLILINLFSILIPFLIVSRQLILATCILTGFCVMDRNKNKEVKIGLILLIILFVSWFGVSQTRNQDNEYLKDALQIQDNSILSVPNMQVYMYLTMNFDNFDYNVDKNFECYYGTKSLFPMFVFTGLKFTNNYFVDVTSTAKKIIPVYNTYPIFTAPYFDFNIAGVFLYMFLIGYISCAVNNLEDDKIENIILKSLIKYALLFSFFISFFSNPTFLFYIATIMILFYLFKHCSFMGGQNDENNNGVNVNI